MVHVLPQALPSDPEVLSASAAVKSAQDAAASMLFSLGISAHMIDDIGGPGPLIDAIRAAGSLQSDTTFLRPEDGTFDRVLNDKLLPYLKRAVRRRKIVISVDKKDQKMAQGRSIVNVTITSVHLKRAIVAEV